MGSELRTGRRPADEKPDKEGTEVGKREPGSADGGERL